MFTGAAVNLATCWLVSQGVPWNVLPLTIFMADSLAIPSITLILLEVLPEFRGMASSAQDRLVYDVGGVAGSVAPSSPVRCRCSPSA